MASPKTLDKPKGKRSFGQKITRTFEIFAQKTSKIVGTAYSFGLAVTVIVVWGITGPIFKYSDSWQLIINTGTTIITFLMVFLLQHTQNKDSMALQLKLDEIIAAVEGASNRMINIEELSEEDLTDLKNRYQELVHEVSRREEHSRSTSVERQSKDVFENVDRPANHPTPPKSIK